MTYEIKIPPKQSYPLTPEEESEECEVSVQVEKYAKKKNRNVKNTYKAWLVLLCLLLFIYHFYFKNRPSQCASIKPIQSASNFVHTASDFVL